MTEQISKAIQVATKAMPNGSIPAPFVSAFDAILSALEAKGNGSKDVEAVIKAVRKLMPEKKETNNAKSTN